MAGVDYRNCDCCGGRAFYDASLNYDYSTKSNPIPKEELIRDSHLKLGHLGDWKVLCTECAKTHKCVIVPINSKITDQIRQLKEPHHGK